jgi:hypothetical protein
VDDLSDSSSEDVHAHKRAGRHADIKFMRVGKRHMDAQRRNGGGRYNNDVKFMRVGK